jgi:hypothetical protein
MEIIYDKQTGFIKAIARSEFKQDLEKFLSNWENVDYIVYSGSLKSREIIKHKINLETLELEPIPGLS